MEKVAYSIPEFIVAAGIGRSTIYNEIAAGRLKIAKVGTRTLIPATEAQRWLADLAAGGAVRDGSEGVVA